MSFVFEPFSFPEVVLVKSTVFCDARGSFFELFRADAFQAAGLPDSFVQDNCSISHAGVVRGLHYQIPPFAQGKLIRVVAGAAWDVFVDVRQGSPTLGKWACIELREGDGQAIYIPPGFAHGFAALADDTRVVYKCTAVYEPSHERGIRWDDPTLAIPWPVKRPVVSARDAALPLLSDAALFVGP